MKAEELTNKILDEIFLELVKEYPHPPAIIPTRVIAKKLWQKYRIPIKKQAEVVRKKIKNWWNSKPWIFHPRPHKKIGGIAVFLASPMIYDYCILERRGYTYGSLICVYPNQKEFEGFKNES